MTKAQIALIAHAVLLIAALCYLVPTLTTMLGPQTGYLASLACYWLGFCVPVFFAHVHKRHDANLFSERLAWREWWIPLLLLVQVTAIAAVAVAPHTSLLSTDAVFLAMLIAVINGPLEEIAWRGGFLTRFTDRPKLGFWLNWVLFSAWHVPLTFSNGIVFEGGFLALVGGASVLGLLWSAIAWRTGSVFWVAIAHTLTNVLTFSVLFAGNGFV